MEEALEKLKELPNTEERRISQHGIITEGVDNIQIKLAKCCSPVPGDEIVGYVTRGRGLSVHRKDCSNILNNTTPERFMEVRWDDNKQNSYSVELKILAYTVKKTHQLRAPREHLAEGRQIGRASCRERV